MHVFLLVNSGLRISTESCAAVLNAGSNLRISLRASNRRAARKRRNDCGRRQGSPTRKGCVLQRNPAPLLRGPVAGILDFDGLARQIEIGARLTSMHHALHEILDFLQIATRPFLFEAQELPSGFTVDLLGDVDIRQLLFIRQIANQVIVRCDVHEPPLVYTSITLRTPPMIMSPEKMLPLVPSENVSVSMPQFSTSSGLLLI